MSLGAALLQPDVLSRPTPDGAAALIEDVTRLLALFIEDAAAGGPLAGAAQAALFATGPRLQAELAPRLAAVQAKLRTRLDGPRAYIESLAADAARLEQNPAAIITLLRRVVSDLKTAAEALTLPRIRTELEFVRGILIDDLLLGPEFLRQVALWYLDELLTRLAALPIDANLAQARRLRLARALLGRLRLQLASLPMPAIDVEALARAIDSLLRRTGVSQAVRELSCALDGIEAALDAAIAVGGVVRPTPLPVGAGVVPLTDSTEYAWYASWLLNDEDIPLLGISELKQPQPFVNQIRTSVGRMGTWLRDQFSPEERAVLDSFTSPTDEVPRAVLLTVVGVVNRAMQRGPILGSGDDRRLAPNEMTDDIRELEEKFVADQSLFLFNRRVLEAAFPGLLEELSGGFCRGLERTVLPIIGWSRNQVYVTGDRKFVMCDDKPIHLGTDVKWFDAPIFSASVPGQLWFKFEHIGNEACEILAQVLFTSGEAGKAIWHLVDTQPGHEIQAGFVGGIEIADTLQQFLFGKPVSAYFLESGPSARSWGKSLDSMLGLKGIATVGASFQGLHTDAPFGNMSSFWVTVISGDIFRAAGPVQMVNTIRDIILSFVTLLNFRGPQDGPSTLPPNPARNHVKQGPFVSLSDSLFSMLLISLSPRDNYSILLWSKDGAGDKRLESLLGHWLGGSVGMGVLAGLSGSLVAQIIAWAEDWGRFFATAGISAGKMFGLYWVFNYLFKENSTDGGRYKPGGGTFKGYPDKSRAPSPYRLPYPGGVGRYVSQGNLGLWSHNFISNQDFATPANSATQQTYAYDFGHDFGENIACVRAGTVVAFTDTFPDSNENNPNRIVIRHTTIDPEHDDFGSGAVQTYSVYLHLATNGVTGAPRFAGVTPIVGTVVAQGDLIAKAGDTGMSFHNHLHLHIVPDDGAGNPSGDFAIPFVFDDVSGDGVPKSLTWYRSGNT